MKSSFMSISMLVTLVAMAAMLLCGFSASAQSSARSSKFVYDKKENVETVFTLDDTGRFLTPKLKYEYADNEAGRMKVAYRWNVETAVWTPCYRLIYTDNMDYSTIEYAAWDSKSKAFAYDIQKAVYYKGLNDDIVSYMYYRWDLLEKNWRADLSLLLKDYLALATDSLD